MSLSEVIRQLVRQRAGNRCEYCLSHQDYTMGRLQIDHVQPTARGGTDSEENLCLACELCNQFTRTLGSNWTEYPQPDYGKKMVTSKNLLFHLPSASMLKQLAITMLSAKH